MDEKYFCTRKGKPYLLAIEEERKKYVLCQVFLESYFDKIKKGDILQAVVIHIRENQNMLESLRHRMILNLCYSNPKWIVGVGIKSWTYTWERIVIGLTGISSYIWLYRGRCNRQYNGEHNYTMGVYSEELSHFVDCFTDIKSHAQCNLKELCHKWVAWEKNYLTQHRVLR